MTTSHHTFSGGSHHQLSFPWLWYPSCSPSSHSSPLGVYSKHSSRLNPFKMIECQIISLLCSESFSGSPCPQRKSRSQWFLILSKTTILYQGPQGSAWTGSSLLFLWLRFLLPLATWLHSHFFLLFCEHTGHTLILGLNLLNSVRFLSHVQLCNPMDHSTPGLPVHHQLPEFTQTHVCWVSDAIQPSHPLLPPSPAFSLSQDQGLSNESVLHAR